jgi:hypothetical protein
MVCSEASIQNGKNRDDGRQKKHRTNEVDADHPVANDPIKDGKYDERREHSDRKRSKSGDNQHR